MSEMQAEIARDREVMEHAVLAYVGLEYLEDAAEDGDKAVKDEFDPGLNGAAEDVLFELRSQVAWVIANKAASVYRRGNGLPLPDKERTDDV